MLRVLVAEDSATTRALLVALLGSDEQLRVVGEAKNGAEAIAMTKDLRPDVVTMDIRMPIMDGFEATKQIMIEAPTPIVIVSATVEVRDVEVSVQALRAGALAVLPPPVGPSSPEFEESRQRFLGTVKAMSQVKVVRRWPERSSRESRAPRWDPASAMGPPPRIVALAASTGGPSALCEVLSGLPGDFPLPIVVVQHIAEGFVSGFASMLTSAATLNAKLAEPGESIQPRTIYIAPDDRHLGLRDPGTLLLSNAPAIGGFRPSASFLFESVAKVFGRSTLAVILTGMGSDGLDGLRVVRQHGGRIVAQDEASSVVFGMPGAAASAGLVDITLPLSAIAGYILQATRAERGGS